MPAACPWAFPRSGNSEDKAAQRLVSRKKSKRRRRRLPHIRRLTAPGTPPGTVRTPLAAPPPRIRRIRYSAEEFLEEEVTDLPRLPWSPADQAVTWLNVDGLGDAATIEALGAMFGLHRLALEDVVNLHQRAKVEEYGEHLYIVLRMVSPGRPLETEQLSLFLGRNFVLTFQERPGDCLEPVRERLRQSRGRMRETAADYLAYAIIDAVLDAYFPVVDDCGERLEELDERMSVEHFPEAMSVLHHVRGDLMLLRRAIRPLRDALVRLTPDPHALFRPETQLYLRDCFDHTVQLIDLLDTYREMCGDLRDFHLSAVSNRMNEIMKVLTIIATVFMPLSFIAGIYGMNFNTEIPGNMPELNWRYGYVLSLGVMLAVALSLVAFFWRRGWLSRSGLSIPLPEEHHEPEPHA